MEISQRASDASFSLEVDTMADEKVGALEPHCLDDAFQGVFRMDKKFLKDADVQRAFRCAARAYEDQQRRMDREKVVGPLPNQCARQAFLDALDLEPKRKD
jgi:hypothetical protein